MKPIGKAETQDSRAMGRREFIGAAAAALFAGVAVQIVGCGGTDDDDGGTVNPGDIKANVATVNSHTHTAIITKAKLDAGADTTVELQTASGHEHTVSLTAAEVVSIKAGGHVMKDSSTTGSHAHSVMFN
jgi:hypothetical protein